MTTLHHGATDYVLKQRLARLGPAVRRALRESEERRKREQAEKEARASEEQLRAMFDLASIGMASADPQTGQWLRVNPRMCAITGYSAAEMLRMKIPEITHPDDRQKDWEEFQRVVRGEAPDYRLEKRYLRKDGTVAWVNVNMTVILDATGRPRRTMATIEDITGRKQLEQALRESSRFHQQIVTNAQEGIIVYDRDLKYQAWNPYMERMTGRPAGEVLGKRPDDVFPFLRGTGLLGSIEKVLAGEPSDSIEIRVGGLLTGKSDWTSQTNGPLRNGAGEIIGVIGIVQDITKRKRAELRIAAFANLGQRLNSAKTAKEAGEVILNVADELLGWDACLFDLYSPAENKLSYLLSMDILDGRRAECTSPIPYGPPTEAAKRAIEEGGQLILRDHTNAVRPEGLPFGDTSRPSASLMFVPIRHGTEVVGILSIQSYTPRAYDAYSLETLQALADYGGGALARLRAQEALSESEATFRSVWERSIDGMRLTDQEGRIIAVNEAFCRLVKLPREKLEGQVFSVAYQGHGANEGIEVYQKRFTTGDIAPHDTRRAQLWNSEEMALDISNSFIELGQPGKMLLSIFRDVSERKRAEARIEAFSRLGQKLSAAKTGYEAAGIISEVTSDLLGWDAYSFSLLAGPGNLLNHLLQVDTLADRRVECSSGLEPASALASRAIEAGGQLILKEIADQMLPGSQAFGNSTRPSASILYVPIRKGAEVIGVMTIQSYTPRAYDQHSLDTLQALADHCGGALDRITAEEALERERQTAQRYLDIAGAMIVAIDPSQNVLLANRKACQILGCEESDLIGKNWSDSALPEGERDRVKTIFGDLLAGKIAAWEYVEGLVLTRRGEQRLIAWHNTRAAGPDWPGHRHAEFGRGHHGAEGAGGPTAPGAKDGGGGPACRRGGARFQQHARRHPGQCRIVVDG